jgi:hypothetical protein
MITVSKWYEPMDFYQYLVVNPIKGIHDLIWTPLMVLYCLFTWIQMFCGHLDYSGTQHNAFESGVNILSYLIYAAILSSPFVLAYKLKHPPELPKPELRKSDTPESDTNV